MQAVTQRSAHPFLLGFIAYMETSHFPHHRLTFNVTTLLNVTSNPSLVVMWLRFLRETWEGREPGTQPCPRRRYTWLPRMQLRPISPPVPPLRLTEVTLPPRRLLKKDGICVDCAVHHQPLREAHLQLILHILFRRVGGGGRNSHGSLYSDSLLFRPL